MLLFTDFSGEHIFPDEKNHVSMLHDLFQTDAPASAPVTQVLSVGWGTKEVTNQVPNLDGKSCFSPGFSGILGKESIS